MRRADQAPRLDRRTLRGIGCHALAIIVTAGVSTVVAPATAADAPPTPMSMSSMMNGKKIYQGAEAPWSAEAPSCSACHGPRGRGKLEAGVQIPAIAFDVLAAPGTNSNGSRAPYDEASLRRAVTKGIDASGRSLATVMPRQAFTDAQWRDLHRYLTVLGSSEDRESGVGNRVLRVGTVLDLSGPDAELGARIRASIEATFAAVNSRGGIFGRRLALIVEDGGGDPTSRREALRRVLHADPPTLDENSATGIFALVGSMLQPDDPGVAELLTGEHVPLIGPIANTPDQAVSGVTYYLLPSLLEQTHALLERLRREAGTAGRLRVALLSDSSKRSQSLARLLEARLSTLTFDVVIRAEVSSEPGRLASLLRDERVDACLYLGSADVLVEHAALFSGGADSESRFPIAAHAGLLGPRIAALRQPLLERMMLARAVTARSDAGNDPRAGPEQLAIAAAEILVEAAYRSTRRIDRESLTGQLDQLRDFRAGTFPSITFSRPDRVGNHQVAIMRFDRSAGIFVDEPLPTTQTQLESTQKLRP